MRCIFCKADSLVSRTVEHIVPESLGNTEHILPLGVVCDGCNGYFARKIEKPLLDGLYFQLLRFRNAIVNKRGRTPAVKGIHLDSGIGIEVRHFGEEGAVFPINESDGEKFIRSILVNEAGTLVLPDAPEQESDKRLMSRFIGKMALEALAQRFLAVEVGLEEVTDKEELDRLRDYVRWNKGEQDWPFFRRRLYNEDALHKEGVAEYTILHEYTFLYTDDRDLYFVVAICGVEYVMNMGEPDVQGYSRWLNQHEHASPLA
jgi:hypothetical protein